MSNGYTLFCLLMWKNWLLVKRAPFRTASEILVPVLFCSLILIARNLGEVSTVKKDTHFPVYDPAKILKIRNIFGEFRAPQDSKVAWTSKGSEEFRTTCEDIMRTSVGTKLELVPYTDEDELYESLKDTKTTDLQHGDNIFCGVIFDGTETDNKYCHPKLKITLRFPGDLRSIEDLKPFDNWQTQLMYPKKEENGPRDPELLTGPVPGYYGEGFITLQVTLGIRTLAYCMVNGSLEGPPGLRFDEMFSLVSREWIKPMYGIKRYPHVPYVLDTMLDGMRFVVPFTVMLAFIYTALVVTKNVTREKETQMRELMKIMGLPGVLHWVTWFLTIMCILTIACLLIGLIFKIDWIPDNGIFDRANYTVIFGFFMVYAISITCFCFMISSFFTFAHKASVVAGLMFFIFYLPHLFMLGAEKDYPMWAKILLSIFMNVAMAMSMELFLYGQSNGNGLKWVNICIPPKKRMPLTLCHTMMMMLLDAVIYLLVCLYVESIYPGSYGVPKPITFFFRRGHWLGPTISRKSDDTERESIGPDPNYFEKEPRIPAGIRIYHLRKEFSNGKVAVQDLTLSMYDGQITVLLGHNGAGKTTTMSILTGIYPPTSGRAIINGYDVTRNIKAARRSLGICPQINILFDDLTVREHLYFFCKLKGMPNEFIENEIVRFVVNLDLVPKEHNMSKTLSGGMKRKLNAGIALCGNTRVVLLDEPSSGMDPAARRAIWDVLIMEKDGRTMLLSTHFMDEADVLGDRVAIMAGGLLKCSGSPFFLKKRFGGGYRLIIEKGMLCDTSEVTVLLNSHISGLLPSQDVGTELSYQLPEDQVTKFEAMFQELEYASLRLDIKSFGVALTTMEEVFLTMGKDEGVESRVRSRSRRSSIPGTDLIEVSIPRDQDIREELVEGRELFMYRLEALFLKKAIVYCRNWFVFALHCLFPVIFLGLALLTGHGSDSSGMSLVTGGSKDDAQMPPHEITLKSYSGGTITLVIGSKAKTGGGEMAICRILYKSYKRYIEENGGTLNDLGYQKDPVEAYEDDILEKMRKDVRDVRMNYPAGLAIVPSFSLRAHAMYNDFPLHASALSISLVLNSLIRNYGGGIIFVNHPLPLSVETQGILKALFSSAGQIGPMTALAMAFISAYYVQFIIRERECKNKHLQYVSGIHPVMFWTVHFVWDAMFFVFPALVVIVILICFREKGFDTPLQWARVALVLAFFCWAMLPYMYCLSFLFSIPATGYAAVGMLNTFLGTGLMVIILSLKTANVARETLENLDKFLIMFPHYCLADSLYQFLLNYVFGDLCKDRVDTCDTDEINPCCPGKCPDDTCLEYNTNYFGWQPHGVGKHLLSFVLFGLVSFVVLYLIEYQIFNKLCRKLKKDKKKKEGEKEDEEEEEEDDDVAEEKKKIRETNQDVLNKEYTLILRDVTKYYGSFLAVDHTCVGVGAGQCFGLLGSNGAGKTTTFKMMTGDITMTQGEVYVGGLNLQKNRKEVQRMMGYCPQFDALLDELNGWETLKMFCLMRGIKKKDIRRVSEKLAKLLLITNHMARRSGTYSGGNKRKLSTAIALIGNPVVVFLDEPTSGMDPGARRHLWNVICNVRDTGTSVVLTSHSMEECEALCTKIAIQVNGKFKCLGSLQHLKNKFAKGFSLQIKVTPSTFRSMSPPTTRRVTIDQLEAALDPVKQYVRQNFEGAKLEDEYMGMLTYSIPRTNMKWSRMFGIMESAKGMYAIEDYSIGQTSLEQVFLIFTMKQKEV